MIVGITGATGIIYGVRLLEALKELGIERHLVLSKAAEIIRAYETSFGATDIRALADFTYSPSDIGAPIASGSFKTMGMIVAPCSIRTLSDIAHGTTSGLISRAADVVLERFQRTLNRLGDSQFRIGFPDDGRSGAAGIFWREAKQAGRDRTVRICGTE